MSLKHTKKHSKKEISLIVEVADFYNENKKLKVLIFGSTDLLKNMVEYFLPKKYTNNCNLSQ